MSTPAETLERRAARSGERGIAPAGRDAAAELRKKGLQIGRTTAELEREAQRARAVEDAVHQTRLPLRDLVLFTRQMSMLLTSGSALAPALTAIARQMPRPEHQQMVQAIKEDLEEGLPLTESLRRFRHTFDASYCAVVAAGESSANLPQMFARLATIMGKRRAARNKIIGALIYPLLLTGLSTGIMATMLFFVVPRFAGMFTTLHVPLPGTTRFLLAVGTGLRQHWMVVVGAVVTLVAALVYAVRSAAGRQFLSDVQLRIPLLGRLCSRLIQAGTFRILGMLIEARVGLLECLELARGVTRNRAYQELFTAFDESVTGGNTLSAAMEKFNLVNPSIIQAVRTGEESGRMGEAFTFAADVLDEENGELLNTLTRLVEPLILILMSLVVGTVAISMFVPLFDMTSAV